MELNRNVMLSKYTTLKIGGIANNFYIPESQTELIDLVNNIDEKYYILANGSNILINDKKELKHVIYMNKFNNKLNYNNGIIEAGASVRIQQLINFSHKYELGGLEYLFSVPATVGGAICMNAGRGRGLNKSISDYIIDVTVYDGKSILVLSKDECKFSHRNSIFKNNDYIILSCRLKFNHMSLEKGEKLNKERIRYSKQYQDSSIANAGSTFCLSSKKIMDVLKKLQLGWKDGARFSGKTSNWIVNNGYGNYKQVKILITFTKIIHKILFQKVELEYIEWR